MPSPESHSGDQRQWNTRAGCGCPRANKKAGARPAFAAKLAKLRGSVFRDNRAAPAIIDVHGHHVDVLPDRVVTRERAAHAGEGHIVVAHEQVIVFDAGRPVRRERKVDAGSDCGTPTGFVRAIKNEAARGDNSVVMIAGDSGAAFDIPKNVVPGIADVACNQPERINLAAVGGTDVGSKHAGVRALQVRPIALPFDAEDPTGGLPTISNLTADHPSARIVTAFTKCRSSQNAQVVV